MAVDGFKKIIFSGTIIFLLLPLFVFAQETSITLKEKQVISLLDIIRQYPLSTAQFDLYNEAIYYPDSDNSIKAGAVMLVKQTILQNQLDYWFVKMPAEFSKRFIKAVYKLLPAVAYGDFSGAVDLIEKYTVEQANIYISNWLKQNQVLIGSGIGKYAFPSYKNNQQVINIPYIIVYSPTGINTAKIVVEFYSQKAIEPPQDRGGVGSLGGNQEYAQSTVWPWGSWITSKYNKNNKIEPFIVRVKGQVIKDKYGNFTWDKSVEVGLQQPTVEVEFGKPVPEIDQSDIILKDLLANQSQGFIKDKINEIKQKAEDIINQVKDFFAIFKPQAQISSFIGSEETVKTTSLPLEEIAEQSQEIIEQAEQAVTEEDLLKIKAELEQAIKEKQAELDRLLALATPSASSGQATTTNASSSANSASSSQAICNQATNQEPDFDKVIFNEIAWMGTTKSASDEWIELKNISVRQIDLNGWQIFNKTQNLKIFFTTTTIVKPGEFLLLERTNDDTVPKIKADYIYTGALANTDEMLYLVGSNCVLQDKIKAMPYWQEGDNSTKETMERNQFFGWQTSSVVGGTPKAKNSVGKIKSSGGGAPPVQVVEVVEVGLQQQNSTSSATSTEQATTTQSATTTQQATTTPSASSGQAQILITEIQIEDGSSTQNDFIKLFNYSTSSAVDISDWQLKKRNSNSNEESIKKFTSRQYLIQPQSYFFWMNSEYALTTTTKPDATTTQKISENNSIALFNEVDEIIDQVAWGSSTNPFVEGSPFGQNPNDQQNLIRVQHTGDNSVDFELTATSSSEVVIEELPGITNLMAVPSTVRGSVDLFWTCPTTTLGYIITKDGQEISQNITPKPAGEVETFFVDNLAGGVKYNFSLKYTGLTGGTSATSNIASAIAWSGFQDNADGTITDLQTNLTWQKNANSAINNFGATSTQFNAQYFIDQQNSGWHLANYKELASVFGYNFENIMPEIYWSKNNFMVYQAGYPGDVSRYVGWNFNFQNNMIGSEWYNGGNSNSYRFLAVFGNEIPDNDLTFNTDGTAKDNRTGLLWLNGSFAQAGSKAKNWDAAFNFAANVVLCNDGTLQGTESTVGDCLTHSGIKYDDFRLPNTQEILEITGSSMILAWQNGAYWTLSMFDRDNFWLVGNDFYNMGTISYGEKNSSHSVQLVRDP